MEKAAFSVKEKTAFLIGRPSSEPDSGDSISFELVLYTVPDR
jgi:hypothetical protein